MIANVGNTISGCAIRVFAATTPKTAITNSQGEEKILGFNMSGELLGLDGFANNKYESSVVALHDSEICVIEKNHYGVNPCWYSGGSFHFEHR